MPYRRIQRRGAIQTSAEESSHNIEEDSLRRSRNEFENFKNVEPNTSGVTTHSMCDISRECA
jgi:hypothetical protein